MWCVQCMWCIQSYSINVCLKLLNYIYVVSILQCIIYHILLIIETIFVTLYAPLLNRTENWSKLPSQSKPSYYR